MQEPVWLIVICTIAILAVAVFQIMMSWHRDPWVRYKHSPWASKPRTYHTGPKGGRYFISDSGRKVYRK